jgi:hypothetical protein
MIPYRKEIEAVILQYSSNFLKHEFQYFLKHEFQLFPCKAHIEKHM